MNTFPWLAYLLAFAGAAGGTALSAPLWRRVCRRMGLVDNPGARKIHDREIPLAGGLAVFSGLAGLALLGVGVVRLGLLEPAAAPALAYGLERRASQLAAIFVGALGMLALGLLDDRFELSPPLKFAGQLAIAGLVMASGVRATLFIHHPAWGWSVTALWILTVVNALNFNDNMNGLCAGLGLIAAAWFAWFAARHGQYLVALISLAVLGSLAGFLPYNFPRASIFLGDSGSHLVGYLLAVLAILPHFYSKAIPHARPAAVLTPVFILAVPLLDLAVVSCRRTLARRPFWRGDTNHFSHRLVRFGFSRVSAVALLWAAAAAAGAASLWLEVG